MSDEIYFFDDLEEIANFQNEVVVKKQEITHKPKVKPQKNFLGLTKSEEEELVAILIALLLNVIIFVPLIVYSIWYVRQP